MADSSQNSSAPSFGVALSPGIAEEYSALGPCSSSPTRGVSITNLLEPDKSQVDCQPIASSPVNRALRFSLSPAPHASQNAIHGEQARVKDDGFAQQQVFDKVGDPVCFIPDSVSGGGLGVSAAVPASVGPGGFCAPGPDQISGRFVSTGITLEASLGGSRSAFVQKVDDAADPYGTRNKHYGNVARGRSPGNLTSYNAIRGSSQRKRPASDENADEHPSPRVPKVTGGGDAHFARHSSNVAPSPIDVTMPPSVSCSAAASGAEDNPPAPDPSPVRLAKLHDDQIFQGAKAPYPIHLDGLLQQVQSQNLWLKNHPSQSIVD